MRGFTPEYYETLTGLIGNLEEQTTAELVVEVRPCSGNYRDVDQLVGAGLALGGLGFLLFNPWEHAEWAVLLDVALLFLMGSWLGGAVPSFRRLAPARRRERQVREAAEGAFCRERVSQTRARTGVLIYVSLLEQRVEVLPDSGVTAAVSSEAWNEALQGLRRIWDQPSPAQALLDGLGTFGKVLATALPPHADNPDELPNRPRGARKDEH